MKKTTIAILVTLGLGTALFAIEPCDHGEGMGGSKSIIHKGHRVHVMKDLDLSIAQKQAIKKIRQSQKEAKKARKSSMKKNRKIRRAAMKLDLSTFMTATSFHKTAFKLEMQKKFEQREEIRKQKRMVMINKRAENMEKIFNILTPEQRNKWIQLSQIK